MNGLRLYFRYMRMHVKTALEYKGWPVSVLSTFVFVFTDPIEVLLMFARFGAMGEWTGARVMLVYAIAVGAFGLAELCARGLDYFSALVRTGEFDRIMLRPRSAMLQACMLRFHINRLARVIGGCVMVAFSLSAQGVWLTPVTLLMLIMAFAGGAMVYAGVFVIDAAISFFTLQSLDVIYVFTNGSYQVVKVPVPFLPKYLKTLFVYIVPLLPFCYLPASCICGWGASMWQGFLALPAGLLFFGAACVVWRIGVRHYTSAGS